jgi:hypothetical protein
MTIKFPIVIEGDAASALEFLSVRFGCTRTEMVERLIIKELQKIEWENEKFKK